MHRYLKEPGKQGAKVVSLSALARLEVLNVLLRQKEWADRSLTTWRRVCVCAWSRLIGPELFNKPKAWHDASPQRFGQAGLT